MARLITYSPNGILLPQEAVRRYIRLLVGSATGWEGVAVEKPQWSDSYALIHDVFKSPDGTRICAVDSAWNVAWRLQPSKYFFKTFTSEQNYRPVRYDRNGVRFEINRSAVEELTEMIPKMVDEFRLDCIYYQGRPLQYSYHCSRYEDPYRRARMGLYEIQPMPQMAADEAVELEFSFGGGKYRQTVSVPERPFADMKPTPLLLHTVQKDNEPDWVADWCKFYRRVHQVKRIVIYDNDSANRDSLEKALMAIKDRMEIVLIRWPYEYKGRFNLTQLVALNHCPLLFGDRSEYYMNFDIDEYLINPTRVSLRRYLNRRRDEKRFSYAIPQHPVPNYIEGNIAGKVPRVCDYKYRQKELAGALKTINVFGRFRVLHVHSTSAKSKPWPEPARVSRVWCKLKRLFKLKQRDELYYNHYSGLSTGWKYKERLVQVPEQPAGTVRDRQMAAHLKKARLQ